MSKTENQTSDFPDAHRGHLEENPGTGLLYVKKEEDETDDYRTEIHWSLPADNDNAKIVKVEITEDLCVRQQLGAPDEETSYSISQGRMDVTPSDGVVVEHGGEPYVCNRMKTEEDEVPINTATGDVKTEVPLNAEQTNDLYVENQREAVKQEIGDSIRTGRMDVTPSDGAVVEHGGEPYVCNQVKTEEDEFPKNTATGDVKTEVPLNAEQTNDLYVENQREAVKQEIGDSIRTGRIDVTPSDGVVVEHGGEPYVCNQMKTEEDEFPINTATGDVKTEVTLNAEQTNENQGEAVKQEIGDNIRTGEFTNSNNPSSCKSADASFNLLQNKRSLMKNAFYERGKCFTGNSHLIGHQKINSGKKAFSCSECGKLFGQKSHLNNHLKIHSGEKAFSCSECGKCFTVKSNLISHQKIHSGEKAFSCFECGKCFSRKPNLTRHQKIHTGEKGFLCSQCGKCFALKTTLHAHLKIHAGEKAFSCSDCGKCFTLKSSLISHQKIHTGEKLFSCSDCGKCFTRKPHLITHQNIHTGEKGFSCSHCGKCFALKTTLNTHLTTHTGEKAFSCSDCGKCFARKTLLNRHQKVHTGERAFSCSDCGKRFTRKTHLIKHQNIHIYEKAF
ncbi:zinc finger protein 154-like [Bombina bombina]|uniref:zinc finger protein 154-like n=1 Tax=Bombina bombina TaxID=8345 RepID=UPI00235B025A|nr:zinc finger protein 154-like [Bombina bombina]